MKILYLFNGFRGGVDQQVLRGENHDGHFHGMYRLRNMGFKTDFDEIEKHVSRPWAIRLRSFIGTYYIHLLTFFRIFKYDIIFSPTAFSSLLLKNILRVRRPYWIILDFGLLGMVGENKSWKQKMLKKAVSGADGIITLSPGENKAMQEMFPEKAEKIQCIYHGVDTEYFKPISNLQEEDIIFSPGRDAGRDFKTLIKATSDLPVKTIITARDSFISHLMPLPGNMVHTFYEPFDLVKAYARAKVLVITLSLENHNNDAMGLSTLVEMMSMGKPIIVTDTETTRAYITHGVNGILVKEGDHIALKEAITSLLNDEPRRRKLGDAARVFVVENCSGDIWAKNIAAYFKSFEK